MASKPKNERSRTADRARNRRTNGRPERTDSGSTASSGTAPAPRGGLKGLLIGLVLGASGLGLLRWGPWADDNASTDSNGAPAASVASADPFATLPAPPKMPDDSKEPVVEEPDLPEEKKEPAPYDGPWLGALAQATPIYPTARFSRNRLGYIRRGGKVPSGAKPIRTRSCRQGFYPLVDGGYVCGKYSTLKVNDPRIKRGVKRPDVEKLLPYLYAFNRAHGTPLYAKVPTREQMLVYEPYLAEKKTRKQRKEETEKAKKAAEKADQPRSQAPSDKKAARPSGTKTPTDKTKTASAKDGKPAASDAPAKSKDTASPSSAKAGDKDTNAKKAQKTDTSSKTKKVVKDAAPTNKDGAGKPSGKPKTNVAKTEGAETKKVDKTPAGDSKDDSATTRKAEKKAKASSGKDDKPPTAKNDSAATKKDATAEDGAGGAPPKKPWWQRDKKEKLEISLAELNERDGVLFKRMVRGFYIAVNRTFRSNGRVWYETTDGLIAPADRMIIPKAPEFRGIELKEGTRQAGFIRSHRAYRYAFEEGRDKPKRLKRLARFSAFGLTGKTKLYKKARYRETTEGWWMKGLEGTYTAPQSRPKEVGPDEKWIDVNVTRKTLMAFVGDTPVYATLISPGKRSKIRKRDHRTKLGKWRIREKHVTTTMDGDGTAGELPYSIQDVPYVQYYDGSYALHGAFWHHNFGREQSHGCVNLSPLDSKFLFNWTEPKLPRGWHGVWSSDKRKGTLVNVHK